jgi:hypothetical protein
MTGGPCLTVSTVAGEVTDLGAALAGWAGFLAWTEWVTAALFLYFFEFAFSFFYLIQKLI